MTWNRFVSIAILFAASCNGQQFIPGQQLNAHEQPDTNHRLLRANTGPALYHQTTHLTGDSGARNVPAEHIPIPALRSPHHNTFQQQQQVQPAQPNHIAQPSPALKSPRRPAQHIAPAPKALDNTRRAQLLHNYHEDSDVVAEEEQERRLREHKEAASAHYTFDSNIQDGINDHAIVRQETRDGLALKGMYSYSDGFFQRTVHYEADEHGYRVTKEDIQPIGDGPVYNPKGKADISSSLHPSYSITADDFIREPKKNKVELEKKLH